MEPAAIFATAFVVGLSGALVPGPVTVVLTRHALKDGFIASPLITLAHGLLEVLMVILLAVGLGTLLAGRAAAGMIGVAGGMVLFWMGYGMVRGALRGTVNLEGGDQTGALSTGAFTAGLLSTLSNPYWFLWWVTVGATYVALSQEHGWRGLLLFFGGHILADLLWLSILALALASGRRFITNRMYTGLLSILGVFLIGLAVYFLWSGIGFLT